jgi:hypothetical protein
MAVSDLPAVFSMLVIIVIKGKGPQFVPAQRTVVYLQPLPRPLAFSQDLIGQRSHPLS